METQLQNPIANGWIVGDSLSTTVIGGPESKLYVMYVANDANGIYKTTTKLNSTFEGTELYKSVAETKESRVVEFSLTGISSGNNKLEINNDVVYFFVQVLFDVFIARKEFLKQF